MRRPAPPDEHPDALAVRALDALAGRSRLDPAQFMGAVMREEKPRPGERHAPLVDVAPHNRVLLSFIHAHPVWVVRAPPAHGKTSTIAAYALWRLGDSPGYSDRQLFLALAEKQSTKTLELWQQVVEDRDGSFAMLRVVFPGLAPDPDATWTKTSATVRRPPGTRDPSAAAAGVHTKFQGARADFVLADDTLDGESTSTAEKRRAYCHWFLMSVVTRAMSGDAQVGVSNVPWCADRDSPDLTYYLEREIRWPTLEMDALGGVRTANTDWTSPDLRPARIPDDGGRRCWRLAAHDEPTFDAAEEVPLWPEQFPRDRLDRVRENTSQAVWDQQYRMLPPRGGNRLTDAKVDRCKRLARALEWGLLDGYDGPMFVAAGVDVATGETDGDDRSAIFVAALVPEVRIGPVLAAALDLPEVVRNLRRVLHVESGLWSGDELGRRVVAVARKYNVTRVRVETNGAQKLLLSIVRMLDVSAPCVPHFTGKNKHGAVTGVLALLAEVEQGAWAIPATHTLAAESTPLADAIDGATNYDPTKHTRDETMAWWLAREQLRIAAAEVGESAPDPRGLSLGALGRFAPT